jgi:hypothetical protein
MEAVGTNFPYYPGLWAPNNDRNKPIIALDANAYMYSIGSSIKGKKVRLWPNASSNPNSYRVQFVGRNAHDRNFCRLDNDQVKCDLRQNDTKAQSFVFTKKDDTYYLNAEVNGVLHPCKNSSVYKGKVTCKNDNTESDVYLNL